MMEFPEELTDPIRQVLSLMVWRTGQVARELRRHGWKIPEKAEDEQAVVLHWLLKMALRHGDKWAEEAMKTLNPGKEVQKKVEPKGVS